MIILNNHARDDKLALITAPAPAFSSFSSLSTIERCPISFQQLACFVPLSFQSTQSLTVGVEP